MKINWPLYDYLFFWIPLGALSISVFFVRKILKKHYVVKEFIGHTTSTYIGDSKVIPVVRKLLLFTAFMSWMIIFVYLMFFVFIFGRN